MPILDPSNIYHLSTSTNFSPRRSVLKKTSQSERTFQYSSSKGRFHEASKYYISTSSNFHPRSILRQCSKSDKILENSLSQSVKTKIDTVSRFEEIDDFSERLGREWSWDKKTVQCLPSKDSDNEEIQSNNHVDRLDQRLPTEVDPSLCLCSLDNSHLLEQRNRNEDTKISCHYTYLQSNDDSDLNYEMCRRRIIHESNDERIDELSSWFEHCRDPIALRSREIEQRVLLNPEKQEMFLRYCHDLNLIETEDCPSYSQETPEKVSYTMNKVEEKLGCGSITGAVDDMKKLSMEFRHFFNCMKYSKELDKLYADLLSPISRQYKFPTYPFSTDILRFVLLLPGNQKCYECDYRSQEKVDFGCPMYGIVFCEHCAKNHMRLTSSYVEGNLLSLRNDNWSFPDILAMIEGGNQSLINHIQMFESQPRKKSNKLASVHETHSLVSECDEKYNSLVFSSYRRVLLDRVIKTLSKM